MVVLACLLSASAARAATFAVTSMSDASDALPGDGLCATAAGDCTLRAAIEESNALSGSDQIVLPAGARRITAGELVITDEVTISGAGGTKTKVRGNRKARVFHFTGAATVALTGLQIQQGSADSGGGIYNEGIATLNDVVFSGNLARGGTGFGLGAALYNASSGTVELTNVTFTGNAASGSLGSFGGGLYNLGSATLSNVTFRGNRATGCGGGVYNNGIAQLADVTFRRNHVLNSGGGLFNETGTVSVVDSVVTDNRASQIGGGLFSYGSMTLTNVTINRNRAFNGGGLFNSYGTVTLTNVTISANRSSYGGGLYNHYVFNQGTAVLKNTILWGNKPQNCSSDPITSLGHNLDSGSTCAFGAAGDLNNTDPVLGPLRNNGGLTLTRALLPSSPAIDAGDDVGCPATDQCGVTRPLDGNGDSVATCDIGAYEVHP